MTDDDNSPLGDKHLMRKALPGFLLLAGMLMFLWAMCIGAVMIFVHLFRG